MNKKLLLATMSLAALAACTTDDFESQKAAAEASSPIEFEVINIDDARTRASMDGNSVKFSAKDGDLFTLYHGGSLSGSNLTSYENATYKANAEEGQAARLSTPTMIKAGKAIMVWPTDTTFRATGNLDIKIPQNQTANIQHELPYVSDLIDIQTYAAYSETATPPAKPTAFTTAGYYRKYPVYMRPMASQLNLKADYGNTENQIKELYEGEAGVETGEGIDPITVSSVELLTTLGGTGADNFTLKVPLSFTTPATTPVNIQARWNEADANNTWSHVTGFDVANIGAWAADGAGSKTEKLTTKYLLENNKGCKFLILPQATISGGVDDAGVVVNTRYGKVVIADPTAPNPHKTKYTAAEYNNAWYRYLPASGKITTATTEENVSAATAEASGDNAGLFKTVAKNLALGMQQTINYMSTYTAKAPLRTVETEPIGVALTRYVNVNLSHLDMSDLHIKDDKQLRDAARVWKKMGLDDVTVLLDGKGAAGEFEISQKTIKVINDINASIAGGTKSFKVMPCTVTGEVCNTIVVTGASDIQNVQDMPFIVKNGTQTVDVALKAGETWKWGVDNKVIVPAAAVAKIINRGTLLSDATATIKTQEAPRATGAQNNVPFVNDGTWNVKAPATLNVQFDVTNNGTVNIAKNAQYRQDGQTQNTKFINEATNKPGRFGGDDSKIGKVENNGVFATVAASTKKAEIYNYGLIEHADKDAKTYITANQTLAANGFSADASFTTAFKHDATGNTGNKMGRINLPYSNKEEDNISVSAALAQGFVSVTVSTADAPSDGILNASVVGNKVNYVIVNGGIESISAVSAQVKYVEFNQPNTEIEWAVASANYAGLMVLSPVNIKLGTTINATVTYLGSDMYVGGTFNNTATNWAGYYGDTSGNVATKYITF